jgi:hypothetical protein
MGDLIVFASTRNPEIARLHFPSDHSLDFSALHATVCCVLCFGKR